MTTYTWNGNDKSGDLTDPANWTVNGSNATTAPSSEDDVIIPDNITISYNGSNNIYLIYKSLNIQKDTTITFPTYGTIEIDTTITGEGSLHITEGVTVNLHKDTSAGEVDGVVCGRG